MPTSIGFEVEVQEPQDKRHQDDPHDNVQYPRLVSRNHAVSVTQHNKAFRDEMGSPPLRSLSRKALPPFSRGTRRPTAQLPPILEDPRLSSESVSLFSPTLSLGFPTRLLNGQLLALRLIPERHVQRYVATLADIAVEFGPWSQPISHAVGSSAFSGEPPWTKSAQPLCPRVPIRQNRPALFRDFADVVPTPRKEPGCTFATRPVRKFSA